MSNFIIAALSSTISLIILTFRFRTLVMSSLKKTTENRKNKCYKAKQGAFAVVTADENKIGQINNISKGGLSFQYISNGQLSSGSVEIEIFSTAKSFYLKKLSAKVVVDSEVDNTASLSSLPMRELVLQFEKIMPYQMLMLEHFLQNYTTRQ